MNAEFGAENAVFSAPNPFFGPFFGLPLDRILAILGQSPVASSLNYGPWSKKLGGTVPVRAKKMTHIGPGPGRHYGETAVLRYAEKHFFWPKIRFFSSKKTPEIR